MSPVFIVTGQAACIALFKNEEVSVFRITGFGELLRKNAITACPLKQLKINTKTDNKKSLSAFVGMMNAGTGLMLLIRRKISW